MIVIAGPEAERLIDETRQAIGRQKDQLYAVLGKQIVYNRHHFFSTLTVTMIRN